MPDDTTAGGTGARKAGAFDIRKIIRRPDGLYGVILALVT